MLGQLRIAKESRKKTKDIKDRRENPGKCLLIDILPWIKTYNKSQSTGQILMSCVNSNAWGILNMVGYILRWL